MQGVARGLVLVNLFYFKMKEKFMENSNAMETVVWTLDLLTLIATDILERKILCSSAKQAHCFHLHWEKLGWKYHCCEQRIRERGVVWAGWKNHRSEGQSVLSLIWMKLRLRLIRFGCPVVCWVPLGVRLHVCIKLVFHSEVRWKCFSTRDIF